MLNVTFLTSASVIYLVEICLNFLLKLKFDSKLRRFVFLIYFVISNVSTRVICFLLGSFVCVFKSELCK